MYIIGKEEAQSQRRGCDDGNMKQSYVMWSHEKRSTACWPLEVER